MLLRSVRNAITQHSSGTLRSKSRGQSIVELAFVTPLLLLMLVIAGDLGRAYTAYLTVGSAAGAGASYAIISEDFANDAAAIEAVALADAGTIWGGTPTVTVNNDPGNIDPTFNFRWVEVTVTYEFSPVFRFWPIPSSIPMERTVRMPVLGTGG
jgi:Flp pilus assembly protein TadG